MVHTGFSRGCDRCRDKHLGCDQNRPQCTKCVSQGLPCPGYRDQGGFLFKNESAKVIRNGKQRHARRATAVAYAGSKGELTIEPVSRSSLQSHNSPVPHLTSSKPSKQAQAREYNRLHFFLETYAMFKRNITVTRVDFDTMASFYRRADISSPLLPVLSQVAGQLLLLYNRIPDNSPWHIRSCVEASKAMRAALCDPIQRRKNETLLALVLLDLGERIEYARLHFPSLVEHHNAAMALISERDPDSFRDEVSQTLLDATRYIVIRKALWANEENLNLEVFARVENGRQMTHSMALDHIISRVLILRRQVSVCLRSEHRYSSRVLDHLSSMRQDLDTQLREWAKTIPESWYPSLQSNPGLETLSGNRKLVEIFATYETAFIYNQWRCIRLLLLGITQSLSLPKPAVNVTLETDENGQVIREKAETLCGAILSSAPYLFGKPRCKHQIHARNEIRILDPWEDDLENDEKMIWKNNTNGSRLGHWNLFELLQWMLRILADVDHGIVVDLSIIVEAKEFLAHLWF